MTWLHDHGVPLEIVAVTDGDASHARSTPHHAIRAGRAATRRTGSGRSPSSVSEMSRSTDSACPTPPSARTRQALRAAFERRLDVRDDVRRPVAARRPSGPRGRGPSGTGGGRAPIGAGCLEVPIWARVRGRRCSPSHVLELGAFRAQKIEAVRSYRSQIVPLGPDAVDGPGRTSRRARRAHLVDGVAGGGSRDDRRRAATSGHDRRVLRRACGPPVRIPWDHAGRFYEHRKYAMTAAALQSERYGRSSNPAVRPVCSPRCSRHGPSGTSPPIDIRARSR